MKIVNLAAPAIIEGALRYPVEGPFTVTNDEAAHLKREDKLDGEPEDLPEDDEQAETAKPKRGAANKES